MMLVVLGFSSLILRETDLPENNNRTARCDVSSQNALKYRALTLTLVRFLLLPSDQETIFNKKQHSIRYKLLDQQGLTNDIGYMHTGF
jgi:hypothetical protein